MAGKRGAFCKRVIPGCCLSAPSRVDTWNREECEGDSWRLYEDVAANQRLVDAGGLIVNHSAAHYPVVERRSWEEVCADFRECGVLTRGLQGSDRYWASPFSFVQTAHLEALKSSAVLVQVENRAYTMQSLRPGILYRHDPGMRRAPEIRA